eukprot:2355537-Prymnesium_polylepis.2
MSLSKPGSCCGSSAHPRAWRLWVGFRETDRQPRARRTIHEARHRGTEREAQRHTHSAQTLQIHSGSGG